MNRIGSTTIRSAATVVAAALALTVLAGFMPVSDPAAAAPRAAAFESLLAPAEPGQKMTESGFAALTEVVAPGPKTATVVPAPTPVAGTRNAAPATGTSRPTGAASSTTGGTSEQATAQAILNRYIGQYPILAGSTVTFGDAKGYQAICYYQSGRIVISPTHTASLEAIMAHEIWHIIDWRDNGVIDWGENVPPSSM